MKFLPTSMTDFMKGPEAQQPLMDVWLGYVTFSLCGLVVYGACQAIPPQLCIG